MKIEPQCAVLTMITTKKRHPMGRQWFCGKTSFDRLRRAKMVVIPKRKHVSEHVCLIWATAAKFVNWKEPFFILGFVKKCFHQQILAKNQQKRESGIGLHGLTNFAEFGRTVLRLDRVLMTGPRVARIDMQSVNDNDHVYVHSSIDDHDL